MYVCTAAGNLPSAVQVVLQMTALQNTHTFFNKEQLLAATVYVWKLMLLAGTCNLLTFYVITVGFSRPVSLCMSDKVKATFTSCCNAGAVS